MGVILLGTAAFQREEAPKVTLKNYFYEQAPANLEDGEEKFDRVCALAKRFGAAIGEGAVRALKTVPAIR